MPRLDDPDRLEALAATGLMDTEPEESFDRLTRLAAHMLKAPVAVVTLLDDRRQFLKSAVGLPTGEGPLSHSFCRHVVEDDAPFIVADAHHHPRVRENPAVAESGITAYCGVPLTTSAGATLGSLCVVEKIPREWTPAEVQLLEELAAATVTEIELRSANRILQARERALAASEERFRRIFEDAAIGMALVALDGAWLQVNPRLCLMLGRRESELLGGSFTSITHPEDQECHLDAVAALAAGERGEAVFEKRYVRSDGELVWARVSLALIREGERPLHYISQIEDITERRRVEEERDALHEQQTELLNLLPDTLVALYGPDLRCLALRGSVLASTGLDRESFIGRPLEETVPRSQVDQLRPRILSALAGVESSGRYVSELTGRTYSAEVVPYRRAGAIVGALLVGRDITEQLAREAQMRMLATIVEQSGEAIIAKDDRAVITAWNGGAERLYGYTAEEAVGRPISLIIPPERTGEDVQLLARAMAGETIPAHQTRRMRRDGSRIDVMLSVSPLLDADGTPTGASVIARDITAQIAAEHARRDVEERLRVTIEHSPVGVALVDLRRGATGRLLSANDGLERILGGPTGPGVPRSLLDLVHPDELSGVAADLQTLSEAPNARAEREVRVIGAGGRADWVLLAGASVPALAGPPRQAVVHVLPIGERKRAEQELQFLAEHDPLTGLRNRRSFATELSSALAAARGHHALSVLLIDLDGFKAINDTLGHSAGDAVIVGFAELLSESLRSSDIIARLGGDEFVALLPHASAEQATAVAEKLLSATRERLGHAGADGHLTASVGAASFDPAEPVEDTALLAAADAAMYEAKQLGRDRCVTHVALVGAGSPS
ncbi:MAG TPA: PAS domain S-box protein [Solirubrobacteraceae bacterium]|nr:PAS domain S-box protein [Solirubrobacteraceae bacterium]